MEPGCTEKYNVVQGIFSYAYCTAYSTCNISLDIDYGYFQKQIDVENIPQNQMCKIYFDTQWNSRPYKIKLQSLNLDKSIVGTGATMILYEGGWRPYNNDFYTGDTLIIDAFWDDTRMFNGHFFIYP